MHFDRIDIVSAWSLALQHCHTGQWSPEYARACKIHELGYFTPECTDELEDLSDNAREIYEQACGAILGTVQ